MALSDKQTLPKRGNPIGGNTGDSRHNPNKQKDKMRTYAQVMKSHQERDCFDLQHKTTAELGQLTEGGQLFIHAKDKNSIVIDIAQFIDANVNFKDLGILLRTQYPDALGLRIRSASKGTQYFEINFRTASAREEALKKDFSYKDKKVTVSRTFPKDATIIRMSISDLPYEDETIIKKHMGEIFSRFGEILEMGLLYTVHGHWFTGRGFVTLNKVPGKTYEELTPQINSWEDNDKLCLTFTNMKPSCSRCHVTDHVFGNCPVMMGIKVKPCYICGSIEHLQAGCPKAWWNLSKAARKVAKLNAAHKSPNQQTPKNVDPVTVESHIADESPREVPSEISPVFQVQEENTVVLNEQANDLIVVVEDIAEKVVVDITEQETIEPTTADDVESSQEQLEDNAVVSDEDMDSEIDDSDIDMEEANKEATATNVPLEQVLATMRLKLKRAKNKKKKALKQTKGTKALGQQVRGSRAGGGVAKGQKQSTNNSLKL